MGSYSKNPRCSYEVSQNSYSDGNETLPINPDGGTVDEVDAEIIGLTFYDADANDIVDGPVTLDCFLASNSAFPMASTTVNRENKPFWVKPRIIRGCSGPAGPVTPAFFRLYRPSPKPYFLCLVHQVGHFQ